jgi:hypothetical protein
VSTEKYSNSAIGRWLAPLSSPGSELTVSQTGRSLVSTKMSTSSDHSAGSTSGQSDVHARHAEQDEATVTSGVTIAEVDANQVIHNNIANTIGPSANDILLGRGRPFQTSSGNKRMHEIISKYKAQYAAHPRDQKRLFVETVLEAILKDGTRFLRRVETGDGSGLWEEVDRSTASEKVWHALRLGKDRIPGGHCSNGGSQESPHGARLPSQLFSQPASSSQGSSLQQVIHRLATHISENLANATASAQVLVVMVGGAPGMMPPPPPTVFVGTSGTNTILGQHQQPVSLESTTQGLPFTAQYALNGLSQTSVDFPAASLGASHRHSHPLNGNFELRQSLVSPRTEFTITPNGSTTAARAPQVMQALADLADLVRERAYQNVAGPLPPPSWLP